MKEEDDQPIESRALFWTIVGTIATIVGVVIAAFQLWGSSEPTHSITPQPPTTSTTSTPPVVSPTPPTASSSSAILHKGPLVMRSDGPRADLDALPDDHQWTGEGTTGADIMYSVSGLSPGWPGALIMAWDGKEEPDCRVQTGYGSDLYIKPAERLALGRPWVCVQTTQGRFATVKIEKATKNPESGDVDQVSLDVTTNQ